MVNTLKNCPQKFYVWLNLETDTAEVQNDLISKLSENRYHCQKCSITVSKIGYFKKNERNRGKIPKNLQKL